jgi:hypothetical protein
LAAKNALLSESGDGRLSSAKRLDDPSPRRAGASHPKGRSAAEERRSRLTATGRRGHGNRGFGKLSPEWRNGKWWSRGETRASLVAALKVGGLSMKPLSFFAFLMGALASAGVASAQESAPSVIRQCGDKWAAAKAAGTMGDLTWAGFLSQCRAEMAVKDAVAARPGGVLPKTMSKQDTEVAAQAAEKSKLDLAAMKVKPPPSSGYAEIYLAKEGITKIMRDPDSAVFSDVFFVNDRKSAQGYYVPVVCGTVNGRNGFGGMTGPKHFVAVMSDLVHGVWLEGTTAQDVVAAEWNRFCAGSH